MLDGERKPGARWIERDAILAMALLEYESDLCGDCGQPRHESMDPENEDRYHAPLPFRCHACTVVAARAKEYAEAVHPQALKFTSVLVERPGASPQAQAGPGPRR